MIYASVADDPARMPMSVFTVPLSTVFLPALQWSFSLYPVYSRLEGERAEERRFGSRGSVRTVG
jgi:hypothetical protein